MSRMLALFGFDPENRRASAGRSQRRECVLLINCLTIDNRNFLVDSRNCGQFIIESEINVLLRQDAELAIRGGFGRKRLITRP